MRMSHPLPLMAHLVLYLLLFFRFKYKLFQNKNYMNWCKIILKPSVPLFKIEPKLGVNNFLFIRNTFFCRIRENYRYEPQQCVTKK